MQIATHIRDWAEAMPHSLGNGVSVVKQPSKANSTLNSWKEIAVFFNRGVRTVQRWEGELGLPVHRVRPTEHSPVFAYVRELELWLRSRSGVAAQGAMADVQRWQAQGWRPRDGARKTLQRSRELLHDLIEHRKKTETLVHSLEVIVQVLRERRNGGLFTKPNVRA